MSVAPDIAAAYKYVPLIQSKEDDSSTSLPNGISRISQEQIRFGSLLGTGGFSTVRQVEVTLRNKKRVYAIKYLRRSVILDPAFETAASDLVTEAKVLSQLRHEHIIRLYGVGSFQGSHHQHFLILDRLTCTLDKRIDEWRLEAQDQPTPTGALSTVETERLHDRIQCAVIPIAKALRYIHSKHLIFRDLKPANIGFDANGTAKLFDFGLACSIDSRIRERSGSPRYMSPEIMQKQDYGTSTDVYSFSLLEWQVATLEQPFGDVTDRVVLKRSVVHENRRPPAGYKCGSLRLQELIVRGWDKEPQERPDMAEIVQVLEAETATPAKRAPPKLLKKIRLKRLPRLSSNRTLTVPVCAA